MATKHISVTNVLKCLYTKVNFRQHCRSHLRQRLYQCCYGKCQRKYRHPQDLARHALTHTQQTFECDLCEKTFKQKRLLRRHEAIHSTMFCYYCQLCKKALYIIINSIGIVNLVPSSLISDTVINS